MRILLLAPYPPYPPHGGGTMRIYQLAIGLAKQHDVTVLACVADAAVEAALAPMRKQCRVLTVVGLPVRSLLQRAWTTVASPLPDMVLRNASSAYQQALNALLAQEQFDLVQAESIEMSQYLPALKTLPNKPMLVFDTFNVEYLLQKRAALTSLKAAIQPRNPRAALKSLAGGIYSLAQWGKLAAYERWVMQHCDAVAAVSEDDQRMLQQLAPKARISVVPNGVDSTTFSRAALGELAPTSGPTVVFSGTLDFRANIDAVSWFAQAVWPLIKERCPTARFLVVGRKATPALQALAAAGILELTGEVADARPYLASATVYIVPMRIGGGVRLKLLEALALEAAVVSTSMGAEGVLGLKHGTHCLLADDPAHFAEATLTLIKNPQIGRNLAAHGRELVAAGYDWQTIIPRLERMYN